MDRESENLFSYILMELGETKLYGKFRITIVNRRTYQKQLSLEDKNIGNRERKILCKLLYRFCPVGIDNGFVEGSFFVLLDDKLIKVGFDKIFRLEESSQLSRLQLNIGGKEKRKLSKAYSNYPLVVEFKANKNSIRIKRVSNRGKSVKRQNIKCYPIFEDICFDVFDKLEVIGIDQKISMSGTIIIYLCNDVVSFNGKVKGYNNIPRYVYFKNWGLEERGTKR